MGKTPHICVTKSVRSEVLCVSSKLKTQEQNTVGKNWVFPYIEGNNLSFSDTVRYRLVLQEPMILGVEEWESFHV